MGLLREETDRSYLYGRLMALYHKLEYDTFTKDEQGTRVTNTEHLMAMMVRNPAKTIVTLEEKIKRQKQTKARVFTYGNDIEMVWFQI